MKKQLLNLVAMAIVALAISACDTHELDDEPGRLVPLTVMEDASLPSITVNGTRLHAETFGDPNNTMIVAIHGGPGGDYRSILNLQDLANDGYFVVFYDQRGTGLSQRHNEDIFKTQLYIDDLDAIINYYKQPNQKVILAGHSWGAMLAAGYVNEYPNGADGLILMEPGGLTWKDTEEYLEKAMPIDVFSEHINDVVIMDQFITSSEHDVLDYKMSLMVSADFDPDNKQGNAGPIPIWRSGAVMAHDLMEYVDENPFDFTTNLGQYQPKVLFAHSELSEAYPRSWAEKVSSPFTNVEIVEAQGTGHEIVHFGWPSMYSLIMEYLNDLD